MKPGLYLDLPEETYFGVDALGSSDLKKLLRAPCDWWYSSRHNPHYRPADRSASLILGRALHALMLEGSQAYEARFAVEPDPLEHPGALKTSDQIRDFLDTFGTPAPKKFSKPELIAFAKEQGFGGRVWAVIMEDHMREKMQGKAAISAAQDRALRDMAELVEEAPSIAGGLKAGLPELSVFWHREGEEDILLRARLDSLAPHMTLDLKTLSNWKGRSVSDMPRRQIEEFEYDIQRRFYDEAREQARRFIREDAIYLPDAYDQSDTDYIRGAKWLDDQTQAILNAIAERDQWVWVWLFYQMRDDTAGKAPIVIPRFHQPVGEVWDEAARKIDRALLNYRDHVARFGTERPWFHMEETQELEDKDLAGLQFKTAT